MASPAQIAANRQNALKSTGPRTPEGKAKVRLNSLVHGLRTQDVVLAGEDQQAFDELRRSFLEKYRPQDPDELYCVDKMIASYWRSRRIPKIEAELFSNRISGMAVAFTQDASAWDGFARLTRYESSLDRIFYRALNQLRELQAARSQSEPPPAVEHQATAPAPERSAAVPPPTPAAPYAVPPATPIATPPASEIGFARPNPPKRYSIDARGRMTELQPDHICGQNVKSEASVLSASTDQR